MKPDKAEAVYEHGLLRVEVPFKDPMEDAVKVAIKTAGAETKPATIATKTAPPAIATRQQTRGRRTGPGALRRRARVAPRLGFADLRAWR